MRRARFTSGAEEIWHRPVKGWRAISPRALLWWFLFPIRTHRTGLTLSGLLLVALAMAIGTAAYNSANNILFLTLSLVLACIILSGVLSAVNFQGLSWRLDVEAPLRAGQEHPVVLHLRNAKRVLPTYSLWFELRLKRSGELHELMLRSRLDAQGQARIELPVTFDRRGVETLELTYLGSLYPFGFLRKAIMAGTAKEVVIWPAPVEYRRLAPAAWQRVATGNLLRRVGQSGDLLALRRYQMDDSHRQIHWKASARMRQLMVRQMSAESGDGFSIWIDLEAERWPRAEQFELLCSFAGTLAEDLFTAGKLRAVGLTGVALSATRSVRDLEQFLDRLALAAPLAAPASESAPPFDLSRRTPVRHSASLNLLTFAPDGVRGVAAYLHGERAAAA